MARELNAKTQYKNAIRKRNAKTLVMTHLRFIYTVVKIALS